MQKPSLDETEAVLGASSDTDTQNEPASSDSLPTSRKMPLALSELVGPTRRSSRRLQRRKEGTRGPTMTTAAPERLSSDSALPLPASSDKSPQKAKSTRKKRAVSEDSNEQIPLSPPPKKRLPMDPDPATPKFNAPLPREHASDPQIYRNSAVGKGAASLSPTVTLTRDASLFHPPDHVNHLPNAYSHTTFDPRHTNASGSMTNQSPNMYGHPYPPQMPTSYGVSPRAVQEPLFQAAQMHGYRDPNFAKTPPPRHKRSEWMNDDYLRSKYSKFQCPFCNRLFKNNNGLRYHVVNNVCVESKESMFYQRTFSILAGQQFLHPDAYAAGPSSPRPPLPPPDKDKDHDNEHRTI